MDLYQGLLSRRSVRRFTDEAVSDELISKIIKGAMFAPSANNTQPWHFIVSRDQSIFEGFIEVHPHSKMLLQADCGIFILRNLDTQTNDGYGISDCAAATQNLLLAAHAEGLGTCWIGTYPRIQRIDYLKDKFDLPAHLEPFSTVALGWPAQSPRQPERFDAKKIDWR